MIFSKRHFAVVDVETTGLFPGGFDKVVEVAAIRFTEDGKVAEEYVTLVNPKRDVGPVHKHGITASQVKNAPMFDEVIGDLTEVLAEAIVVGHNVRFDLNFLRSEFASAGAALPDLPSVCTLQLACRIGLGRRKLEECCSCLGIPLVQAHSAVHDARATQHLLIKGLEHVRSKDHEYANDLDRCWHAVPPRSAWPKRLRSGKKLTRDASEQARWSEVAYLEKLVAKLPNIPAASPDLVAYMELLDRVLEDRRVTEQEANALLQLASTWGISRADALAAHDTYLLALAQAAIADGIVTDCERKDLLEVTRLLGLKQGDLESALRSARSLHSTLTPVDCGSVSSKKSELAGKTICFTGQLIGMLNGVPISREQAHQIVSEAGMLVRESVTKKLDILVVADPDTASGKAEKARKLGTRIMAEAALWRALGVPAE